MRFPLAVTISLSYAGAFENEPCRYYKPSGIPACVAQLRKEVIMPSSWSWDNLSISVNGIYLTPTHINTQRQHHTSVTEFEIQGFVTDEALVKGGGDMGAQFPRDGTTLGSYGYAVKCLAEGLANAVDRGFLTDDEAKEEFRMHVTVVKEKDNREAYIRHLKDQIENLKAGKPALMPGTIT